MDGPSLMAPNQPAAASPAAKHPWPSGHRRSPGNFRRPPHRP